MKEWRDILFVVVDVVVISRWRFLLLCWSSDRWESFDQNGCVNENLFSLGTLVWNPCLAKPTWCGLSAWRPLWPRLYSRVAGIWWPNMACQLACCTVELSFDQSLVAKHSLPADMLHCWAHLCVMQLFKSVWSLDIIKDNNKLRNSWCFCPSLQNNHDMYLT
jgi:hypothetical protein